MMKKIIGKLGILSISIIFRIRDINFTFYLHVLKTLSYIVRWLYTICLFFDPTWNEKWGSESELQNALFFNFPLMSESPMLDKTSTPAQLPQLTPRNTPPKVHTPAAPCFDWKMAFDATDSSIVLSNCVSPTSEDTDSFGYPPFKQNVFVGPSKNDSFKTHGFGSRVPSSRSDYFDDMYGHPGFPLPNVESERHSSTKDSVPTLPNVQPPTGESKRRDSEEAGVMHNIFHKWKLPKRSRSKLQSSGSSVQSQDVSHNEPVGKPADVAPKKSDGSGTEKPLVKPALEVLELAKPTPSANAVQNSLLQLEISSNEMNAHQRKLQSPNLEKFKNVFRKRPVST